MQNTSSSETTTDAEGTPNAPARASHEVARTPETVIEDGARDVVRAGSEVTRAVAKAGIAVAEDIERGVQTVVDGSEVLASDVAAAAQRVGRDAVDAVTGPQKPLEPETEPIVAATLAQSA
jgi:hypothetical protein